MALSGVDAIGVIGTAISAFSFFADLFGSPKSKGPTVRIYASGGNDPGTSGNQNMPTDGTVMNVWSYDESNTLLGKSSGHHVNKNGFHNFHVDQGNNKQALYIDVVAGDDAICIPVISVTEPSGNQFSFIGDVFNACDLPWYYGNVYINNDHRPKCGWLDANHEKSRAASFKYYVPAFSVDKGSNDYSKDMDYYCHPRAFEVREDAQPIEKRNSEQSQARSDRIRRGFRTKQLITSPDAQHPASELCESPTSAGHDFVSLHEKTFCDMGNKRWYHLCDEESGLLDNCFALDIANKTLTGQFSHPKALGLVDDIFAYDVITQWE